MPRQPKDLASKMRVFESPFGAGADRESFAAEMSVLGFKSEPFPVLGLLVEDTEPRVVLEWLDLAAGMVVAGRQAPHHTAKERRERLASLKAAHAVAITTGDRSRLDTLTEKTGQGLPGLGMAEQSLDFVGERIESAAKLPSIALPGRPISGDPWQRILVGFLAAIWEAGTGKSAAISGDMDKGCFPRFLERVFGRLGPLPTRSSLRGLTQRRRRRVETPKG